MDTPHRMTTSLLDISDAVPDLPAADRDEVAAFGSLVDWELVNFLAKHDLELSRQSFTWKPDEVLLVVKLVKDGIPYVVFISRQSPIHCMRTFVRQVMAGTLRMYPDKFS